MALRVFRTGRVSDGQIATLIEEIEARWPVNNPIIAVGGFSHIYGDEGWGRKLKDKETASVSSATITERNGAFTIRYRRAAAGEAADEISIFGPDPGVIPARHDEAQIAELAVLIRQVLPMAAHSVQEPGLIA